MSDVLRVGIIGAGWAGSSHARSYARLENVEVVGIWSRTRSRAENVAAEIELSAATVYDDWHAMIEQGGIDVISITTPAATRLAPVKMAIEKGLHVLVEKPFAADLSQAQEMADLAGTSNTITAVSLNWRYSPGSQLAYRTIQEGVIGNIKAVTSRWLVRIPGNIEEFISRRPWQKRTETGGGIMRQGGPHDFDRVRFLTGQDFERVVARVSYVSGTDTHRDDACHMMVELGGGILADFHLMVTPGEGKWDVFLVGDEGSLSVTHEGVTRQSRKDSDATKLQPQDRDEVPKDVKLLQHTWNRLIENFCQAIRKAGVGRQEAQHLPTFRDGLWTQRLIDAAERSNEEKRWVDIKEDS